jgi:hypothetical protein
MPIFSTSLENRKRPSRKPLACVRRVDCNWEIMVEFSLSPDMLHVKEVTYIILSIQRSDEAKAERNSLYGALPDISSEIKYIFEVASGNNKRSMPKLT